MRAAPWPTHCSLCIGHQTQPPGQMLGKIKSWKQICKRVAVPAARQLDVTVNPVQKGDLCPQILTSGKRAVKGSGAPKTSASQTRLQLMFISKMGISYLKDTLGTVQKTPQGSAQHYEQHSQPASPLAQGRGSQGFMQVHSFLLKRGFVIISYYRTELDCYKTELNPLFYSISEHFMNYNAIITQLV